MWITSTEFGQHFEVPAPGASLHECSCFQTQTSFHLFQHISEASRLEELPRERS